MLTIRAVAHKGQIGAGGRSRVARTGCGGHTGDPSRRLPRRGDKLWDGGLGPVAELEIPHGPCASFRAPGGQRFAVYELVRPGAAEYFTGRIDDQ
jgi:hypothetical protein